MKISKKTIVTSIIALSIAGGAAAVYAKKDREKCDVDKVTLVQEAKLTVDDAIKVALADMPGKVIEAELEKDDGVMVWEIELVNNQSELYEFEIDANSGAILESEREDD